MNFRQFIYYCALCGGWAAFAAWAVVWSLGIPMVLGKMTNPVLSASLTGGILGLLVAGVVGAMDALLNAVGMQRIIRVLVCMGIGMVGGLIGGFIAGMLYKTAEFFLVFGWMLTGAMIGASVGAFDLFRAVLTREDTWMAFKKIINGLIGGLIGGILGGLAFGMISKELNSLPRGSLAIGLVILGMLIGLLIGLAQVFLKEAWIRIEHGFRAGREVMLSKEVTSIGRAEACDIGLFRDNAIERMHALISLQNNRYVLSDQGTPGGTYLNDVKITKPTPLKNGDMIRVGGCQLRFGERQKR